MPSIEMSRTLTGPKSSAAGDANGHIVWPLTGNRSVARRSVGSTIVYPSSLAACAPRRRLIVRNRQAPGNDDALPGSRPAHVRAAALGRLTASPPRSQLPPHELGRTHGRGDRGDAGPPPASGALRQFPPPGGPHQEGVPAPVAFDFDALVRHSVAPCRPVPDLSRGARRRPCGGRVIIGPALRVKPKKGICFEFQNWAVVALGGVPNRRKSGDEGIDGHFYPVAEESKKGVKDGDQLDFMKWDDGLGPSGGRIRLEPTDPRVVNTRPLDASQADLGPPGTLDTPGPPAPAAAATPRPLVPSRRS